MRKVRTHIFNGKRCDVITDKVDGLAHRSKDCDLLFVNADLNTKKGLISLIHEAGHLGNWDKQEKVIDRFSEELGSLLWRLGYRRKEK